MALCEKREHFISTTFRIPKSFWDRTALSRYETYPLLLSKRDWSHFIPQRVETWLLKLIKGLNPPIGMA